MKPLTILVATRSTDLPDSLQHLFAHTEDIDLRIVASKWTDLQTALKTDTPDIIIIDLLTPDKKDFSLIKSLHKATTDHPVLTFVLYDDLQPDQMMQVLEHGVREFIPFEKDPNALLYAIEKQRLLYSRFSGPEVTRKRGHLFGVFSPKGGNGSSTIALNLANELREQTGDTVAFFEMDPVFSSIKMMLNLQPEFCLADIGKYVLGDIDNALLNKLMVEHDSGIDFLVTCKSVMDENIMVQPALLNRALDFLQSKYDYVLVDMPSHTLDTYHQCIADRADMILVVADTDVPSLYRTVQYMELAKSHLTEDKLKLVLNRFDLQGAYGMPNKDLEKQFGYPVFARLSDDWELNLQANSMGSVLNKVNANSPLCKDIRQLARKVMGTESVTGTSSKTFGLLSRLASNLMPKSPQPDKEPAADATR